MFAPSPRWAWRRGRERSGKASSAPSLQQILLGDTACFAVHGHDPQHLLWHLWSCWSRESTLLTRSS